MTASVEDLVRLLGSPAAMAAIAPTLRIGRGVSCDAFATARAADADRAERRWLAADGMAILRRATPAATAADLGRAVTALHDLELPAAFVYAYDETWAIGEQTRARISSAMARDYVLVEDVWAWHVAPGGRGWPAHRGISHERLERDAPEVLNVWVALTDVAADRACMHAVPLGDDPGYPSALDMTTAPLHAVRALPVAAGDALFWNANLLHWGGACAERVPGARVSCSFTLCRADAAARFPELTALAPLASLDLTARMDIVARMVLLYGGEDRGDVRGPVHEWAKLTRSLVARFARA